MIYVPKLYNLEAEYKALDNQNFSNNIFPLLLFIMDQKKTNSPKSISDDFENLIRRKLNNNFFVSIPQNLPLTSKPLKPTVNRFYTVQRSVPNSYVDLIVYSYEIVPLFRRNGYRCSGQTIPLDRNRDTVNKLLCASLLA